MPAVLLWFIFAILWSGNKFDVVLLYILGSSIFIVAPLVMLRDRKPILPIAKNICIACLATLIIIAFLVCVYFFVMVFNKNIDFGNFMVTFMFAFSIAADSYCIYKYVLLLNDLNTYLMKATSNDGPIP
mmetsp:Transcript_42552/g.40807  ORF Transcript_42552/g.40807 Transcript_42552/m.40807 type:complete len:129 (-) Transcript_42552:272-658(-)